MWSCGKCRLINIFIFTFTNTKSSPFVLFWFLFLADDEMLQTEPIHPTNVCKAPPLEKGYVAEGYVEFSSVALKLKRHLLYIGPPGKEFGNYYISLRVYYFKIVAVCVQKKSFFQHFRSFLSCLPNFTISVTIIPEQHPFVSPLCFHPDDHFRNQNTQSYSKLIWYMNKAKKIRVHFSGIDHSKKSKWIRSKLDTAMVLTTFCPDSHFSF